MDNPTTRLLPMGQLKKRNGACSAISGWSGKYNLDFSLEAVRKAHFIGIGGIGMSGIAQLMRAMKYDISGSDMEKSLITDRLENMGIKVFYDHNKSTYRTS